MFYSNTYVNFFFEISVKLKRNSFINFSRLDAYPGLKCSGGK